MKEFKKYYNMTQSLKEDAQDGGKANEDQDKIFSAIVDMFHKNPKPEDEVIHKLADDLGMEANELEDYVYELLGSVIAAGKSYEKKFTRKDADPKQLEIGILVEIGEHSNNKIIAEKIALDHLSEDKIYYTHLIESDVVDEKEALDLYKKYYAK